MAAVAPNLPAADLRALLLQHAVAPRRRSARAWSTRSARSSPPAPRRATALGQPPQLRVLSATARGPRDRRPRSRCSAPRRRGPRSSSSSTAAGSRPCAAAAASQRSACAGAHRPPADGRRAGRRRPGARDGERPRPRRPRRQARRRHRRPHRGSAVRRMLGLAAALAVLAAPSSQRPRRQPRRARSLMSGASPVQALVADLAFFYRRETRARRASRSSAAARDRASRTPRVGSSTPGSSGRALDPGDPPGLVFTPLALSAVCLVTNVANPVPTLTRAQIQDLVAGRLAAWPQVAGLAACSARSPPWRSTSRPAPAPCSCPCSSTSRRRSPTRRARSTRPPRCARSCSSPGGLGLPRPRLHAGPAHGALRGRPVHGDRVRTTGAPRRSASSPAASHAARSRASCAGSRATPPRSG